MAFGKEAEQAQNYKQPSDDEIETEPELDRFDECKKKNNHQKIVFSK
jgi:hypothetical protein